MLKRFLSLGFWGLLSMSAIAQTTLSIGETTITEADTYYIKTAGTYTLTTGGEAVDMKLVVRANATIILDNCHFATTRSDPGHTVSFSEKATAVTFLLRGENTITFDYTGTTLAPQAAIAADGATTLTFDVAEEPEATNTLYVRTSSSAKHGVAPPIDVSNGGTLVFRGGNVKIATCEANIITDTYFIPSLATANTVLISGGSVTAQLCPRAVSTSDALSSFYLTSWSDTDPKKPRTNYLFDCSTFSFTAGLVTTEGEATPAQDKSVYLTATSEAYDTHFCYPHATLRSCLTSATDKNLSGGVVKSASYAMFYGFPVGATIPETCFKNGAEVTVASDGRAAFYLAKYPDVEMVYADTESQKLVAIFGAPLTATDAGATATAAFGVSNVSASETNGITLTLALALPEETEDLTRTFAVRIERSSAEAAAEVVAETILTFSRTSVEEPFTATYTLEETVSDLSLGVHRYSVYAHN